MLVRQGRDGNEGAAKSGRMGLALQLHWQEKGEAAAIPDAGKGGRGVGGTTAGMNGRHRHCGARRRDSQRPSCWMLVWQAGVREGDGGTKSVERGHVQRHLTALPLLTVCAIDACLRHMTCPQRSEATSSSQTLCLLRSPQ